MNRSCLFHRILGLVFALTVVLTCLLITSCSGKKNWELVNSQQQLIGPSFSPSIVNFSSPEKGIMLSQSNVYLTDNGGKSWSTITLQTPPCLSGAEIIDDRTYVIGCACSSVKISRDGGTTWTLLDVKNTTMLSFDKEAKGWMAAPFSIFYYDGTSSRKLEKSAETGKIGAISFLTGAEGYFINEKGMLYYTSDNGATWRKNDTLATKHPDLIFADKSIALRFTDNAHGLVAAFDKNKKKFCVLETVDGGKSWKDFGAVDAPLGTPVLSRDNAYLTIMPYSGADKMMVYRNDLAAKK